MPIGDILSVSGHPVVFAVASACKKSVNVVPGPKPRHHAGRLAFEEGEQVDVDGGRLCCRHTMWEALIGLEGAVLQKFRG